MRRPLVVLTIALSAVPGRLLVIERARLDLRPAHGAPGLAARAVRRRVGRPVGRAPSAEAPSDNGGGGGGVVEVSAMMIQFEQTELSAPADAPFVIRFDNKDAGTPHNVEIKDANGQSVFKGEIFNGVAVKDYAVPALAAGTYQFVCTVHPNMVGTLKVGG